MNFILIAVIVLGAIGLIAAIVLFAASKKFAVYEDPRIANPPTETGGKRRQASPKDLCLLHK